MNTNASIRRNFKEYISPTELQSLNTNNTYNLKLSTNQQLDVTKMKDVVSHVLMEHCGISISQPLGQPGTSGSVYTIDSNNNKEKIQLFKKIPGLLRVRDETENIRCPNIMAVKLQGLASKEKYWEARMLREETIMKRLSASNMARYIPRFYFGCTILVPVGNTKIGIRLTFMDVLGGETLRNKLQRNVKINPKVFSNIQQMILLLWKQGMSHNDISINNIMVNTDDSVRLLDFGLATIVSNNVMYSDAWKNNIVPNVSIEQFSKKYEEFFADKNKREQLGSNVRKLNEIFRQLENHKKYYKELYVH